MCCSSNAFVLCSLIIAFNFDDMFVCLCAWCTYLERLPRFLATIMGLRCSALPLNGERVSSRAIATVIQCIAAQSAGINNIQQSEWILPLHWLWHGILQFEPYELYSKWRAPLVWPGTLELYNYRNAEIAVFGSCFLSSVSSLFISILLFHSGWIWWFCSLWFNAFYFSIQMDALRLNTTHTQLWVCVLSCIHHSPIHWECKFNS